MLDDGLLKGKNGKVLTQNEIAVNIYADDPVAGLGDKIDKDARIIPPIVENYLGTLQVDERRKAFIPQDLTRIHIVDPSKTEVTFLPLYGNHSETNKIRTTEVKDIVLNHWYLKFAFLKQHGTHFHANLVPDLAASDKVNFTEREKSLQLPTDQEILEHYAKAKHHIEDYKKNANKIQLADIPLPGAHRSFYTTHHDDYSVDPFFLNQHERELFKVCYPKVFNYLFEKGELNWQDPKNTGGKTDANSSTGYSEADIKKELGGMLINNSVLYDNLISGKKIANHTVLGTPGGVSRIETCRLLNMLQGKPLPQHPLDVIEDKLAMAVNELVHDSMLIDFKTKEHEHGGKIRKEVSDIINGIGSDEKKMDNIISLLQRKIAFFQERHVDSHLAKSLSVILSQVNHNQLDSSEVTEFINEFSAVESVEKSLDVEECHLMFEENELGQTELPGLNVDDEKIVSKINPLDYILFREFQSNLAKEKASIVSIDDRNAKRVENLGNVIQDVISIYNDKSVKENKNLETHESRQPRIRNK
jgi:hypothetical protein